MLSIQNQTRVKTNTSVTGCLVPRSLLLIVYLLFIKAKDKGEELRLMFYREILDGYCKVKSARMSSEDVACEHQQTR